MSRFDNYPTAVQSPVCQNSLTVLQTAHISATSFLDIFESQRKQRKAHGAATDKEQDLLRAMMLFASAGLDSTIKHLVRDALPVLVSRDTGVKKQLQDFIAKSMRKREPIDTEMLCSLLFANDPAQHAASQLVYELTASSLQSAEQLLRVGAFFDIPSPEIAKKPRELQAVFDRRNQMAHELDIDFGASNRNRRQRKKDAAISDANKVFEVAQVFLKKVDEKLAT